MSDNRAVLFLRSFPPYEAGDVAGFTPALAQSFIDRSIATFHPAGPAEPVPGGAPTPPSEPDQFAAMDRAALVAFAKANLGMTDEPPAETTDDQLRDALRQQATPAQAAPKAPKTK